MFIYEHDLLVLYHLLVMHWSFWQVVLFRIYTYYPQYELSRAILFEEIAYQRYGNNRSEGKEPVQEEVVEMTENTVEFNDENREDA